MYKKTKKRRSGVPQYTEPHILLAGGARSLDALVPGFTAELERRGGLRYDPGKGFQVFDFGAPFPRGFKTGVEVLSASRRLINETLQDLVTAQGGDRLTIKDKTKVTGLLFDGGGDARSPRVVGVSIDEALGTTSPTADIVFMVNGRRSQLPQWLKVAGIAAPTQVKVDCKMNYASRWMKLPPGFDPDQLFYACVANGRPNLPRGGIALVLEHGVVQFSMTGFEGDRAPLDHGGWMEYAKSLPDRALYDLAARCEPMGPITRFASAPNASYQYHTISKKLPKGLIIMGDAAVALNPVYGQGMTVVRLIFWFFVVIKKNYFSSPLEKYTCSGVAVG